MSTSIKKWNIFSVYLRRTKDQDFVLYKFNLTEIINSIWNLLLCYWNSWLKYVFKKLHKQSLPSCCWFFLEKANTTINFLMLVKRRIHSANPCSYIVFLNSAIIYLCQNIVSGYLYLLSLDYWVNFLVDLRSNLIFKYICRILCLFLQF